MTTSNFTVSCLQAAEGKKLTQTKDVSIFTRIIASKVILGKDDTPDNWREITQAEADEYIRQQEEARADYNATPMNQE